MIVEPCRFRYEIIPLVRINVEYNIAEVYLNTRRHLVNLTLVTKITKIVKSDSQSFKSLNIQNV